MTAPPFSAPWWLRNPHAQTVWGRIVRPRKLVAFRREIVSTPDGDELVLDHLDEAPHAREPLHFIAMHGLEGSSYSVYVQGFLAAVARHGFTATVINFRSCARDPDDLQRMLPNRQPRFYHSGDTGDFDFVVRLLAARMAHVPLVAFGASLGGNVLLKWLGENPRQALVTAAATLSVPYDLASGAKYLESGLGRFYVSHFLRTLNPKLLAVAERFPGVRSTIDVGAALRARTFREFDDAATAPLHGFTSADDYYERSSSLRYLPRITTPTLAVSAEDDPFLPREALGAAIDAAPDALQIVRTPFGGHTGFVSGRVPWRCTYWAEEYLVEWLVQRALPGWSAAEEKTARRSRNQTQNEEVRMKN